MNRNEVPLEHHYGFVRTGNLVSLFNICAGVCTVYFVQLYHFSRLSLSSARSTMAYLFFVVFLNICESLTLVM